jgi:prevent-host-death family protein
LTSTDSFALIDASIDRCREIMERRIDAHIARTQFGQIMDRAVKNNERFIVDRRGEPAVVIMSVQDFIRIAAPPPDWLQKAWAGAKRRGLDALTLDDIDTEIAAHREGHGNLERKSAEAGQDPNRDGN